MDNFVGALLSIGGRILALACSMPEWLLTVGFSTVLSKIRRFSWYGICLNLAKFLILLCVSF